MTTDTVYNFNVIDKSGLTIKRKKITNKNWDCS